MVSNFFCLQGRWKSPLPFKSRITIALGSSEGLKYLHEDHNPALVHRDVKSANILLDKNLVPKVLKQPMENVMVFLKCS